VLNGVAVGAGVFTAGGGIFRCNAGVVAGDTDGLATGVMEGDVLNEIEGEGRVRAAGETEAVGVAVAAGAVRDAAGVVIGRAEEDTDADGATDAAGLGLTVGDGRIRTEGDTHGVALDDTVAVAAGADGVVIGRAEGEADGSTDAVGLGLTVGDGRIRTEGNTVGVALDNAAAVARGVVVAVAVAAGATGELGADVSSGLINFFGGALGGGVASVLILLRARSAAERSAIAVQPLSMTASATRSFTIRGRGMPGISTMIGADTSSSSPRTVAGAISAFICDCRRRR
jgi:hypothetical protein